MIGTFPGKLALAEGEEVEVDLEIAGGRLRLTTGVSEIGSWPIEACAITETSDGYNLTLDEELVSFQPDHPDAFSAVVHAMGPDTSVSSAAPAEPVPSFDLEAALDQVLGGGDDDYSSIVPDESADDIAVTLEALFATAYPEFDESSETADAPTDTAPEPTDGQEDGPVPHGDEADLDPFAATPTAAASADTALDEPDTEADRVDWTHIPHEPAVSATDDRATFQTTEWDHSNDVPEWDPAAVPAVDEEASHTDVAETVDVPEPSLESEAEVDAVASWSAEQSVDELLGAGHEDEWDEVDSGSDDEIDALIGVGASDTYSAAEEPLSEAIEEDEEEADEVEVQPELLAEAIGFDLDDYRAEEPAAIADRSPEPMVYPTPDPEPAFDPPAHERYEQPSEEVDDLRPAASFDLDAAVSSAGYAGTVEAGESETQAVPARRGLSGMFSKSATERFASVAGAMRERAAGDGDDIGGGDSGDDDGETLSVADQIKATQEQLRSGAKINRFTPALVKKITIGFVIVFVITGLVLSTPTVIRFLVDQIQSDEVAQPTATTVPSETTVPVEQTSTTVAESTTPPDTEPDGAPVVPAEDVFSLSVPGFVERWNSVATDLGTGFNPLLITRELDPGTFGLGFTEFVGLEWALDDDSTMSLYRLVLDPDGEAADDAIGIQALGVAINVAEPALTGPELRAVLADLGLDVVDPTLELDGSIDRDGIRYTLQYDDSRDLVILTIAPAIGEPAPPEESEG